MENKICMIYPGQKSTWIQKDINILESLGYSVKERSFRFDSSVKVVFQIFGQFIHMFKLIRSKEIIICQGAGYHSLVPSIMGRMLSVKVIIIAIGTDCVSYPSINYGNHRKWLYALFTRLSFKYCLLICPVHEKLFFYENRFYPKDRVNQGIHSFLPQIDKTKIRVINNGYNQDRWINKKLIRPKNTLLAVVGRITPLNYKLKGIDLIFELARERKELSFTIIGTPEIPLPSLPNVSIIPFVEQSNLVQYYNENYYYLQLSISEGLPNSLCEAMLCGCIPIGSSNSSIPEIIGNKDFIVNIKNVERLNKVLNTISKMDDHEKLRNVFRDRIIEKYPESKRQNEFSEMIKAL